MTSALKIRYFVLVLFITLFPHDGLVRNTLSAEKQLIVAFGDSLTAGHGVAVDEAYPSQLLRKLRAEGFAVDIKNAGVSGETTAGGLRRVSWILKSNPDIVILELGANDGLRGLSLLEMEMNLSKIINRLQDAEVKVVLAGMKIPPNYGKRYAKGFEAVYPRLAKKFNLALIPFFLEGVAAKPSLNQADGIHPTKEGYKIITEEIWPIIKKALDS